MFGMRAILIVTAQINQRDVEGIVEPFSANQDCFNQLMPLQCD
jgi:hypothetical protein